MHAMLAILGLLGSVMLDTVVLDTVVLVNVVVPVSEVLLRAMLLDSVVLDPMVLGGGTREPLKELDRQLVTFVLFTHTEKPLLADGQGNVAKPEPA
jgi:hypothetical protein